MFDHGKARTSTRTPPPPSASIQLREENFKADLMPVIYCRVRRDEHNGESLSCVKAVWSGSATVILRNEQKTDLV